MWSKSISSFSVHGFLYHNTLACHHWFFDLHPAKQFSKRHDAQGHRNIFTLKFLFIQYILIILFSSPIFSQVLLTSPPISFMPLLPFPLNTNKRTKIQTKQKFNKKLWCRHTNTQNQQNQKLYYINKKIRKVKNAQMKQYVKEKLYKNT